MFIILAVTADIAIINRI